MNKAEKAAEEKRIGTEIAQDIAWRWKGRGDHIRAAAVVASHCQLSEEREAAMLDGLGLKWARMQMGGAIIVIKEWPDRIIYTATDSGEEFYSFENGKRGARLKVED